MINFQAYILFLGPTRQLGTVELSAFIFMKNLRTKTFCNFHTGYAMKQWGKQSILNENYVKSIHSANCFHQNFVKNLVGHHKNRKLVLTDMLASLLLAVFLTSKSVLLGAFECYKIGSSTNLHLVELNYSIILLHGRAYRII